VILTGVILKFFVCMGKKVWAILLFVHWHLFEGFPKFLQLYLESGKVWISSVFLCLDGNDVPKGLNFGAQGFDIGCGIFFFSCCVCLRVGGGFA